MDRARTLPRLYFGVFAGLTLIGVLLRTVAMLTVFDPAIGYFDPGVLPMLSNALYVATAILAILGVLVFPACGLPAAEMRISARMPFAILLGASMVGFSVGALIDRGPFLIQTAKALSAAKAADTLTQQDVVAVLPTVLPPLALIVFGVAGALYFLLTAKKQGRVSDRLVAAMWIPLAFCLAGVGETYMDVYVTMNSPVKIALQMGFVGFMLLLIPEMRYRLGRPARRLAAACYAIGIFLTLNAAIPLLAVAGRWEHSLHTFYAVVLLCAGLYGGYTFCRLAFAPAGDEAAPPAEN